MSAAGKKARNLELYRVNLEERIEQGDWSLVCKDEKLCQEVQGLLKDGWSQDTIPFPGLDPLQVMEDSLKTATPTPGRAGEGTGLTGLERAFEVLELAALNLYLCPWRKEYRVVKMFSGMFTHYVKPSLSRPQVLELFGLLGYQAGEARKSEELCLRPPSLPLDSLLGLACAFFTARCECRLLLDASRKHAAAAGTGGGGAADWEASLVQERRRGHNLEVSLENAKRRLDAAAPPTAGEEDVLGSSALEPDLDLYTAEGLERNGGHGEEEAGPGGEGPRSPAWVPRSAAGKSARDSNGVSAAPREAVCVSTLNYQLTRSPPLAAANAAAKPRESPPYGEQQARPAPDRADSLSLSLARLNNRADAAASSSAATSPDGAQICAKPEKTFAARGGDGDRDALRRTDRPVLSRRAAARRSVGDDDDDDDSSLQEQQQRGRSLRHGGGGASVSPPPPSPIHSRDETPSSSASASHGYPGPPGGWSPAAAPPPRPIPLHECCDPAGPEPHLVCVSCSVFHDAACKNVEFCLKKHQVRLLGSCSTEACRKPPHVLCRFCGAEFCKNCWYRRPLHCACGQPFDQSSSV